MNMALACDIIVAAESAKFDSRFMQIGLGPGGGHSWRLREKAGDQVARAMLLFGEALSGEHAAEVGLAWKCVPDDALLDEARALAGKAASAPSRLARSIKSTIDATRDITASLPAVERETGPQAQSLRSPEFMQLVASLQDQISSADPGVE